MGICGSKIIRSRSYIDVLESTVWIREILISRLKKRKSSVSKFKNFSFEPIKGNGTIEDVSRVSIEYLNGKEELEEVHWIVRISHASAELIRECEVRQRLLPSLLNLLESRSYKRAKYLLNIPDTVFIDIKEYSAQLYYHLVTEDIEITKKCRPPSKDVLQSGLDLSHMKVVIATLAQFHAVTIAWKQSIQDDSILDLHPYLHRSYPISLDRRNILLTRYERLVREALDDLDDRLIHKLNLFKQLSPGLDETTLEDDLSSPTGTVCLGPISQHQLNFQYTPVPQALQLSSSKNAKQDPVMLNYTDVPVCAALTKVNNVCFSTIEKDLALWIFTLANETVRDHYLLTLLQSYTFVLTSTLEMLGVKWQKLDVTFNEFAVRFFNQIPYAVLTSILVCMEGITDQQILNYRQTLHCRQGVQDPTYLDLDEPPSPQHLAQETEKILQDSPKRTVEEDRLTESRLNFLLLLIKDVNKFI